MVNTLSLLALASTAIAATVKVDVGSSGDVFSPNSITASVGDIIEFTFNGRHSVVQSDFSSPCSSTSSDVINSGTLSSGVFSVKVNSTDPIWLFCGYARHCQSGMTAVINAPSSGDTLDQYTQAAGSTSRSQSPSNVQGGILGDASSFGSSSDSSSSAAASSGTTAAVTGSATTEAASSTGSSGSTASTTTSSGMAATSSSAAEKVVAVGVAGFAGLAAAFLA